MGFVGKMRTLKSTLLVGFLASCVVESDPATPCGALDLGDAEPATMVARSHAPVIAVSSGTGDTQPFVLHFQCEDEREHDCALRQTTLSKLSSGSALMLTADGGWVVAIDADGTVLTWEVHPTAGLVERDPILSDRPRRLVASMRGSNWILVRDGEGEPGNLARFNPADRVMDRIASAELGLTVAAVGEQWAVGRRIRGDGLEDLYLIGVDRAVNPWTTDPVRLVRAPAFSRVFLTPGDAHVVATSGSGRDAETFVFSMPDGKLVDRFAGATITGRRPLEDVPGMRAVSPDGSHVAYRTPSGSIALRNLDTQGACMVRSANAGEHTLAGFSAHGLLYIESETTIGRPLVHAFDPASRRLHGLADSDYTRGLRLAALPGRHVESSERPWAVGVTNGSYFAMQPGAPAAGLKLGQALFMPRDDAAVWAVNSVREATDERRLTIRRIAPRSNGEQHVFSSGGEADVAYVPDRGDPRVFSAFVHSKTCVSTGVPGSWGTQCDNVSSTTFLAAPATPPAEDPYDSGARLEPEVPVLPNDPSGP